ncbi:MAG: VWA domain-containing protein [Anaerolineae bacterium]|nr:VWA domain-containing protein [Anaerolineae bacterium]
MTLQLPFMLAALIVLPVLVALYIHTQRRRFQQASRAAALGFQTAQPIRGMRRHAPATLAFIGITLLLLALTRPLATIRLPQIRGVLILVVDVSGSMAADDVKPSRMEAVKAAARAFIDSQPPTVEIGVVAFSEGGLTVQMPTTDKAALRAAIDRLEPTRGTSLASGILGALKVIDDLNEDVEGAASGLPDDSAPPPQVVRPGSYAPEVIVLISDGENTAPPDPEEGVREAAHRGIRVNTIGVGTPEGAVLQLEGGFSVVTRLYEDVLRQIAEVTGGRYYNARNADDFRAIYNDIGLQMTLEPQRIEITAVFAGLGLALILVSGLMSLIWFGRMP